MTITEKPLSRLVIKEGRECTEFELFEDRVLHRSQTRNGSSECALPLASFETEPATSRFTTPYFRDRMVGGLMMMILAVPALLIVDTVETRYGLLAVFASFECLMIRQACRSYPPQRRKWTFLNKQLTPVLWFIVRPSQFDEAEAFSNAIKTQILNVTLNKSES